MLKQSYPINDISASSSAMVEPLNWKVVGSVGQTFRVTLSLAGPDGKNISSNFYDLLIGDEEQARQECARRAAKFKALRDQFSRDDYYRYFPGLEDTDRIGDKPPVASSFSLPVVEPPGQ